jgi:hypothetical protein
MKNIIQVCSLLSLLVLFTAGAAVAQNGFGTNVDIPFAFNVGDHSYEAGEYIVKLDKMGTGMATLSIQNTKTDEIQRMLLNANGDAAADDVRLVFDTINGQRYLTRLKTTDRTYAIVGSKPDKDAAKVRKVKAVETSGGANLY